MEKVINVSDASITTATIEVKVIQINNRQMTLAVFKQLLVEDILDDNGRMKGNIWGKVNYHTDACKNYHVKSAHLHIIWQKGDELRHGIVNSSNNPNLFDNLWIYDQLFIAV